MYAKFYGNKEDTVAIIIDASGKKILERKVKLFNNQIFSIDINNLSKRAYILKLLSNTKLQTPRFIKN